MTTRIQNILELAERWMAGDPRAGSNLAFLLTTGGTAINDMWWL